MILILKNNLMRIHEDYKFNYKLNFLTKYNENCTEYFVYFKRIILNFGFKSIKFDKKKMILFFLILELITNQKCIITKSSKNLIHLKIKKNSIAGCKVTLHNLNLYEFIDNLNLALPREEMFKGLNYKKNTNKKNTFSSKFQNLFMFYNVESEITGDVQYVDVNFNLNTINDFEKFFVFNFSKIQLLLKN